VIGRREVALRGPFRLRLASASRTCHPAARAAGLAQPRTQAGAILRRYLAVRPLSACPPWSTPRPCRTLHRPSRAGQAASVPGGPPRSA